jgi:hypothetical protein
VPVPLPWALDNDRTVFFDRRKEMFLSSCGGCLLLSFDSHVMGNV